MEYICKYNHTHTYKSVVIYREPIPSPNFEGCQPFSPAVTGGTMSCHNDNPGWHQRQPRRQIDDTSSSMVMDLEDHVDHVNLVTDCHVCCEGRCNVLPGDNFDTGNKEPPRCHPRNRRLSLWQPAMPPATANSAPRQVSALNGRTSRRDIC